MSRIIALDYGGKRTGVAVTDPLQMIAYPLDTIDTSNIIEYLKAYFLKELVETIVLGAPLNMDGSETDATQMVVEFEKKLKENFPNHPVVKVDERLTSRMAKQTLIDAGYKKKDRKNKKLVDTVAAALILQTYLAIK
ncbi:MAG: Holliday junction resolvase RuvX [bacterium]|nr:Holliday junction resolvase RuvX [bacterium]